MKTAPARRQETDARAEIKLGIIMAAGVILVNKTAKTRRGTGWELAGNIAKTVDAATNSNLLYGTWLQAGYKAAHLIYAELELMHDHIAVKREQRRAVIPEGNPFSRLA